MDPEASERVIVIGAGPAGVTAAVQLRRSDLDPLLIEGSEIGGLLRSAHRVENYPGFPGGIRGPELARLLREQTESLGIRLSRDRVTRLGQTEGGFDVETDRGIFHARAVVVASGTRPRPLPPEIDVRSHRERIVHEVADLPRRSRVVILGGGDAAFDYALGLAEDGGRVEICFRGEEARALPLLVRRAREADSIRVNARASAESVSDRNGELEVHLSDGRTLEADGLLVALGREPSLGFVERVLLREIETAGPEGVPGLRLVGDVRRGHYRQTAIAVGDGVRAAMELAESLWTQRQAPCGSPRPRS